MPLGQPISYGALPWAESGWYPPQETEGYKVGWGGSGGRGKTAH